MKRRKNAHEKEDSGSHISKERETEEDNNNDGLSDLPDSILLHILSFLETKDAVATCLLSTRWKNLWKHLSKLTLGSYHFTTSEGFTEFVNQILSLRDASKPVNTLDFHGGSKVKPDLLETVVTYAVSHNINSLRLYYCLRHFPSSLFSCQSLTSLEIWYPNYDIENLVEFPNSVNLPALTYLKLRCFAFSGAKGRVEPFSIFKRLNTLILGDILIRGQGAKTLCILSSTLLDLSIKLDLAFIYPSYSMKLSAPNLCSLTFTGGDSSRKLYGSSLNSIKEVSIDVASNLFHCHCPLSLLNLLTGFVNITSLTVSAATLQVLSLIPDLLSVKSPSWYNLKSLKVQVLQDQLALSMMNDGQMKAHFEPYLHIPEGIVDFLLQNSPSAEFEIVEYEI